MNARSTLPQSDAPIALHQETLAVGKRSVETGRVQVETVVDVESVMLRERLSRDTVDVERVPHDRRVDSAPAIRTEGDRLIVPIVEERLVVTRQLFLVEELILHRRADSETVDIPATRRVMRAVVTREDIESEPQEPTP